MPFPVGVLLLGAACATVGSPQIRNRGTIGGSVANSDPAARFIRLAVVVANAETADAIRKIYYSVSPETSAAIKIFSDINEAETWLSRPLDQLV